MIIMYTKCNPLNNLQRKQADVFALEADEQDLTHRGKSVRDMENFDDIDITDDEVEQGTDDQ